MLRSTSALATATALTSAYNRSDCDSQGDK